MSGTPPSSTSSGPLRCDRCGDLLGVYEPLVAVEGGTFRTTSLAAERHTSAGTTYRHHACHSPEDGAVSGEDAGA